MDAETLKTRAAYQVSFNPQPQRAWTLSFIAPKDDTWAPQTYQAERIRVADRDGKKDTILVSSSTVLPHTR